MCIRDRYTQDAVKLTGRVSKLFDRFDDKVTEVTRAVMESVYSSASDLTDKLSALHPSCSTDLVSPCVSASLLKNVRIPKLNISTFVSPGYYCQVKDLLDHIATNPFQQRYYIDQIMSDLKQNERLVWQSIRDGPYPRTVSEIIENVATTFLPPTKMEEISLSLIHI